MPASVKALANEFLNLADDADKRIDPLQMQKLVYLAQGWSLGLTGGFFASLSKRGVMAPSCPTCITASRRWGMHPSRDG
jgi:hypothetical protein